MLKITIIIKSAILFSIFLTAFTINTYAFNLPSGYSNETKIVALWLFDETNEPNAILTDSAPHKYNLRLGTAGRLVPGKFGNALEITESTGIAANYSRNNPAKTNPEETNTDPNSSPSENIRPETTPILQTLENGNWTVEFWLKIQEAPQNDSIIIDIGRAGEVGFQISLTAGGKSFYVRNTYNSYEAECPTDTAKLTDDTWHHIAFTHFGYTGDIRHYIDGTVPARSNVIAVKKTPPKDILDSLLFLQNNEETNTNNNSQQEPEQAPLDITIGHDRDAKRHFSGLIDEIRLTASRRYVANFTPPGSGG